MRRANSACSAGDSTASRNRRPAAECGDMKSVEPRAHAFRRLLSDRVGVGAKLQIDTPNVVGLAMHQGRLAGMKGRREPEAALGRKLGRHVDVGDEEFVLEGDASEVEAEQAPR